MVLLQVQLLVLLRPLQTLLPSVLSCGQLTAVARPSPLTAAAAAPPPLWSGQLRTWDTKKHLQLHVWL